MSGPDLDHLRTFAEVIELGLVLRRDKRLHWGLRETLDALRSGAARF